MNAKQAQIAILKFPTTVMLVDDDQVLLDDLALYLEKKLPVVTFSKPNEALLYLQKQKTFEKNIKEICFARVNGDELDVAEETALIQCDYLALPTLLYDPQRFSTVAVALVDYAMPKMNGLEFCRKVKDKLIRKIMLTGKADTKLAVKSFNQKIIDQFILKDANEQIDSDIYQALLKEEDIYFANLSSLFPGAYFENTKITKAFLKIAEQFETDRKLVEWYQFDQQGSRLGLDSQGAIYWLVLRSAEDSEKNLAFARDNNAPKTVIQALVKQTHLLFLFSEYEKRLPAKEWNKYIFQISGVVAGSTISYAIIRDNFFSLNRKKIVSYHDYLRKKSDFSCR